MISFNNVSEQIQVSGGYKTTFGNFSSFEEAKNAISKMIAPDGEIRKVLEEVENTIGLHNVNIDIHPTKSDEGFCVSFSINKTKKLS